jgi:glycosyltransferase involved in cell wall biosynthesis
MTQVASSPKVSVIIAVYNSAQFLRQCIDSILVQTLQDFELICVNDGSTDDSGAILDDYAQKDARVRVIHQENAGAGPSRNRGIAEAKGEYLSLLDSDDFFHADMLEKAYAHAKEQDADICIFRTEVYNQQTGETYNAPWTLEENKLPKFQPFSWRDNRYHLFQFCFGWAWDKLFKTTFIKESGLYFPTLRQSQDMYFVYGALSKANKIGWIGDILVTQRVNISTSLSATRSKAPLCFYQSLTLLQEELIRMKTYAQVERSFVNWALEFTLWHLGTLDPESREFILRKLEEEGWDQLGISNRPAKYIYQPIHFQKYQKIRYNVDWEPSTKKLGKLKKLRYRILATITRGELKQHYLRKLVK